MAILYRIHERLLVNSTKGLCIQRGCVNPLSMLSPNAIATLLGQGAISPVRAPPLEMFTGWAGRARKLDELGIDTIGFIVMEPRDIAYAIRASVSKGTEDQETFNAKADKLAVAVQRWQREIKTALGIGDAQERR